VIKTASGELVETEVQIPIYVYHPDELTDKLLGYKVNSDYFEGLFELMKKSFAQKLAGTMGHLERGVGLTGPGMSIFSKYSQVLEADGSPMVVREALQIINQVLDEYLAEQEGDYDSDTRWAVSWFEQFGHAPEAFGVAETLSKAKNTSIDGLVQSGILESRAGKVRLLKRNELDNSWSPEKDTRLTTWEIAQYLIRALDNGGEQSAAERLLRIGLAADPARDLAYRLFTICERKGWAQDALGYNMLVVAWPRLRELASKISAESQGRLL